MKWILRIVLGLVVVLSAAFFIFRTPDTDATQMQAKYGGAPSQFVEIGDGLTVHLRDEGPRNGDTDAPAIILLHGSTADLHTWQPWTDALSATHRVIRFDQIGHGLTGPDPDGDYSKASFVADIDEVADTLGLQTFVLGGSSMGGGHAVAYALAHPDRVDGLVLVGASGAPVRREGGGPSLTYTLAQTPVINQLMAQITPRSIIEDALTEMVTDKASITPETVDRYWELLRYPGNRTATIARFGMERTAFTAEEVATLDMPALVIFGREDPLIPMESGEWYAENLPASEFVLYDDIGHLPHEEAAEASIADMTRWLEALDASAEPVIPTP